MWSTSLSSGDKVNVFVLAFRTKLEVAVEAVTAAGLGEAVAGLEWLLWPPRARSI
jgi:hypothetical protein